ncbi:MAG: DNA cytosine methyltransferase [Flammeovirgaceae bacterium]
MEIQNIKTVDLFSGGGGMSLGFQNVGFPIIAAFDNWKPAIDVYKDNFSHPIHAYDLSTEQSKAFIKKLNPNLIIGGPPCQDFSSAGKRDDTLGRADLTIAYAQIISSIQPELFVMENVERIKKSRILKQAIQIFKDANYGLSMEVLDASLCGVPQSRKRFFLVGRLKETDGFLNPYFQKNLSKKSMTVYDYLGDSLGTEYYYRHPRSYKRRGVFSIHEPSATIRGVNRPIPQGYVKHAGDPVEITEGVRALSTIERSYIQTFPKSFIFKGTKTNLEQIIGNAVPVKLGEFVAKCMSEYLKDKAQNTQKINQQLSLLFDR